MKKNLKTAMIFTGGLVGGIAISGIATVKCVLKSDYIRNGIKDEISNKIVTTLYGDEYTVRRNNTYVSYTDRYNKNYKFDEPIFNTRSEATVVCEQITALFKEYGRVSVADYKDLCGLPSSYKDNSYGWGYPMYVTVNRVRDGYKLSLREPKLLLDK